MKYILGLDLGTGSIGWCLVLLNENNEPMRIIDLGSRVFDTEISSLEERRVARSIRRLIRRRKARIKKTKNLFVKYSYLSREEIRFFYNDKGKESNKLTIEKIDTDLNNILEIRLKGKNEILSYEELYVVLINYVKHRGFKSNRKIDEQTTDKKTSEGKLLTAVNETEKQLVGLQKNNPNATISNLLLDKYKKSNVYHNNDMEYKFGITRKMIEDEVDYILNKQKELGLITQEFINDYKTILFKQLSFSSGPEEGPYSNPLVSMIGNCSYIPGQKRASKNSISYIKYVLLCKLNDLRYFKNNESNICLSSNEIVQLLNVFLSKGKLKYKDIYKIIGEDALIKNIDFINKKTPNNEKRKDDFIQLKKGQIFGKNYFDLKRELKKFGFENIDDKYCDLLSECFSRYKTDEEIRNYLKKANERNELKGLECSSELIDFAVNYKDASKYKTFANVSLEFIYRVNPHLLRGKGLYESLIEEGLYKDNSKCVEELDSIPVINEVLEKLEKKINNRSVVRTIVESRKVVNAIISQYGKPYEIHMEMAKDLTLSKNEKEEYEKKQFGNFRKKQEKVFEIYDKFPDLFNYDITRITSQDILKYDLWKEQQCMCLYTLAKTGDENAARIQERDIFTNYVEIEHIIPYSKSFDDRKNNKILVYTNQNREKGDSLPALFYKDKPGYEKYINIVNTLYGGQEENRYKSIKRNRLLTTDISEYLGDYHARTINDTRYAMVAFKDIMHYSFPNTKVRTYVGSLTDKLRALWRLNNLTSSYASKNYYLKQDSQAALETWKKFGEYCNENPSIDTKKDEKYKTLLKELEKELEKGQKNRENHFHHAIDAAIIACATDKIRMNVEKQEILFRSKNNNFNNLTINQLTSSENTASAEFVVDEITGEVKYERVTFQRDKNNIVEGLQQYYDEQRSKFPLPYKDFVDELLVRCLEMNEDILKIKLKDLGYTNDELKNVTPLTISHYFNPKIKGALHKSSYLGKRDIGEKQVLVKKTSIVSEKFKDKDVDKIFDKDGSQAYVYLKIKEWMTGSKTGKEAFNKNSYPINKNGNPIKKVSIIVHDDIKEEFELKKNQGNYVEKENNIQTLVYKKNNDDKLYFVGMDAYRMKNYLNKDKQLNALLWYAQGKYLNIPFSELEKHDSEWKKYKTIPKDATIRLTKISGESCLCIAGGAFSGVFEIKSLSGDSYDLVASGVDLNKDKARHLITVSQIKDIEIVTVNVLGKIKQWHIDR